MASEGTQREFDFDRGYQLRILRLCQVGCPLAKALLRTLDDHMGLKPYWDLSFEEIAQEMNCSISCARDKANGLKDLALIDFEATDDRKKNRFRITWLNLEETIDHPVKVTSRKAAQMESKTPPRADCDAHTAPGHAQTALGHAHTAPAHAQTALGTTYKRQRTPPPAQGAKPHFPDPEWEEVKIELSLFGMNCVDRAIEAAQRRGMTPEEVAELLRQARETPYHDNAARPAILFRRLTDWNDFYWAPPSEEIKARKAAEAATKAAEQQRVKYLRQQEAAKQRRRQEAENWQQFEQLPPDKQEEFRERARARLPPMLRRNAGAVNVATLKEFLGERSNV